MRLTIQRVSVARVTVDGRTVGAIGAGLVAFVGIGRTDGPSEAAAMAAKLTDLRLFDGVDGKGFDRSVRDVGGAVLAVSQFTLYGDVRRGRRPSFDAAAPPAEARGVYDAFVRELRASGVPVETGEFQAHMRVELTNDGPVTVLVDSDRAF